MNRNRSERKTSALTTVIVCALVFCCFSFFWLFFFQSDVLAVAQHILSGGQTSYNRLIGSLLITLILLIIQNGVYGIVKLSRRTHALTYFPSFLILAFLSALDTETSHGLSLGKWIWISLLLLLVWIISVWLAHKIMQYDNDHNIPTGIFSRRRWLNMLQMIVMMLMVACVGNTNAVYHFRSHAEVALLHDDIDEALLVGRNSHETDENLTMLRIYALSKKDVIGDSLFTYPIKGTSADMLPLHGSRTRLLIYPEDDMWAHFGNLVPAKALTVSQYLDSLAVDTASTRAYIDYRLAGLLIDRKVDSFAVNLQKHYVLFPDSLPRHYREALVLLMHQEKDKGIAPQINYRDSIMENKWNELQEIEDSYSSLKERKLNVDEHFRQTYWYYYLYSK